MSEQQQTVTLEDAYRKACLALGEAVVRERFLTRALEEKAEQDPA